MSTAKKLREGPTPNTARLRQLAQFLRDLPEERWNYRTIHGTFPRQDGSPWTDSLADVMRKKGINTADAYTFKEILEGGRGSCGTTACAVGWMPSAHPDAGIQVVLSDDTPHYESREIPATSEFAFARKFYGLTSDEADYLFAFPDWVDEACDDDDGCYQTLHPDGTMSDPIDWSEYECGEGLRITYESSRREVADHIEAYADALDAAMEVSE